MLYASFWVARDPLAWFIEVFWVVIILHALPLAWRCLPLTQLLCWLLAICALVMIHGGSHTYADAPLGFCLQYLFNFRHNPWDQVRHLTQGCGLAILARELLLRCTPLKRGGLLVFLILVCCPGLSIASELMAWWTARQLGAPTDAFLALRGNAWNMRHMPRDFLLCATGAACSLLLLSRLHNRQLGLRQA
jgi:putative membrane protein